MVFVGVTEWLIVGELEKEGVVVLVELGVIVSVDVGVIDVDPLTE